MCVCKPIGENNQNNINSEKNKNCGRNREQNDGKMGEKEHWSLYFATPSGTHQHVGRLLEKTRAKQNPGFLDPAGPRVKRWYEAEKRTLPASRSCKPGKCKNLCFLLVATEGDLVDLEDPNMFPEARKFIHTAKVCSPVDDPGRGRQDEDVLATSSERAKTKIV